MKKQKLSKKTCQKLHLRKRLLEHYNIFLTTKLYNKILKDIHKNRAIFICRQSSRISIYLEPIYDKYRLNLILFVYDKKRESIVTALPPEATIKEVKQRSKQILKSNKYIEFWD